jgi:hypothetical protein|tara:strand:- start:232 stop:396 length:165 start_codon:yes stop_codon:yes gene_type:complete
MIEVGDLVRIKLPIKMKGKLALVIASDHKGEVHAVRFIDNDLTVNYHHSRLEKL